MEQKYETKLKVWCHQGLLSPSESDGVWSIKHMSDRQFRVRLGFMEEAEIRIYLFISINLLNFYREKDLKVQV